MADLQDYQQSGGYLGLTPEQQRAWALLRQAGLNLPTCITSDGVLQGNYAHLSGPWWSVAPDGATSLALREGWAEPTRQQAGIEDLAASLAALQRLGTRRAPVRGATEMTTTQPQAILWYETCPSCDGSGRSDYPQDPVCPTCHGGGRQLVTRPEESWHVLTAVNLTTHDIVLYGHAGAETLTIPPSGTVARCDTHRARVGQLGLHGLVPTVQVNRVYFGDVTGLPEPTERTIYIVSRIVAEACPERRDLYIVDNTARDGAERIVGARALAQV